MKKALFILSVCLGTYTFAQNALPATGNVGIGTTTPTAELEVKGTTELEEVKVKEAAEFEKGVKVKDDVEIEKELIVDQNIKVKGDAEFNGDVKTDGDIKVLGTTKLDGNTFVEGQFRLNGYKDNSIQDDRFLMIRPNGKIEVLEKGSFFIDLYEGDPCKDGSSGSTIPTWSSLPNVIWTGDVCAPASVGIGTNSPDANLHVTGTGHFGGTVGIGTPNDNGNQLTIVQSAPHLNGIVVNSSSSSSSTFTGIGIQTIVNNPNRIALAVTNETNNQDVFRVMGNGLIYATEMKIRLSQDFPDYVFEENYELMSIDSLENYIDTEGHLPNMPSAEEVKEEGMSVGDIEVKLVEKIEEMTLYIIQLKEQNEMLLKRLEELETKK